MIQVSVMIEGQEGLGWDAWAGLVRVVDSAGFRGLWRSDHFTSPSGPLQDSLDAWTSLTYAASHSERIYFGPLVSPVSFRDPIVLARQGLTLADLSGGRLVLGVGAGWQDREHEMFGYYLGDVDTRMARFEESLEVITRLVRGEEPVDFEGQYYRLHDALLLPKPRSGSLPILIGGNGPKRSLPLVARYADEWNAVSTPAPRFHELSARLDELLEREGRDPTSVRRSMMTNMVYGRDEEELSRKLAEVRERRENLAGKSDAETLTALREGGQVAGLPEAIRAQLAELEAAGAEEVMLQWWDFADEEGLQGFAVSVGLGQ